MKKVKRFEVTIDELSVFAQRFADTLQENTTILLDGQIGAGKTTWTKHLFKALGCTAVVNSPTFTLIKQYDGNKYHLVHVDAYRNVGGGYIDLESYLDTPYILCVEWAEYIDDELPDSYIHIQIETISEHKRAYTVTTNDGRYKGAWTW